MTLRDRLAVGVARAAGAAARGLRFGAGSVLPGVVALRLAPDILESLRQPLARLVLVSGTNGKTTTSLFLRSILRAAGDRVVGNDTGANLEGGLVAALVQAGARARGATGVFEVDEAVLPAITRRLRPDAVVLTNLFRDQLDRYGEVDTVARAWYTAFSHQDASRTLVLNIDDPVLAGLAGAAPARVVTFGLEDVSSASPVPEHGADPRRCPRCGGTLVYRAALFGHIGHYACNQGDWERPQPEVYASDVVAEDLEASRFRLTLPRGETTLTTRIGGVYNVYNAVAAAAAACALDAAAADIVRGLEAAQPAFGRLQRVVIEGRTARMLLIKNPVGASAVLRAAFGPTPPATVLLALNDGLADGTDVSWIWDVDFERIVGFQGPIVVSGERAADLALRLKYAGFPAAQLAIEPDIENAVDRAVAATPRKGQLLLMPTYTAMLRLQDVLHRRGAAPAYWTARVPAA